MQLISIVAASRPGLASSPTILVEIVAGVVVEVARVAVMVPGVVRSLVRALVSIVGPLVIAAFGIAPSMPFVAGGILGSLVGLPIFLVSLLVLRPSGLGIMCHGGNRQQPKAKGQSGGKVKASHAGFPLLTNHDSSPILAISWPGAGGRWDQ